MKSILTIVALFTVVVSQSQITVESYERKHRSEVGEQDKVSPIKASSTCGEVNIIHVDHMASGGCPGTVVRSFTITDKCGNRETAEIYISLSDTKAPELSGVPENVTVDKKDIPPAPLVTSTDNSGIPARVEMKERTFDDHIERTWTAIDACGNKAEAKQVISFAGS